ncbi:MAG: chloride channel protein [Acetobacteraceae bacterium]|nr:chloride channel protein [Acetobacteraceae bacterium]
MPFRSASPSLSGAATAGRIRARRQFRVAVAHVPQTLRAMVRADEIWLVVLAAFVGIWAGIVVVAMAETAQLMHRVLFQLAFGEFLSSQVDVEWQRALLVPSLGGLVLGGAGAALAKWWAGRRTVDPIEANALYGGAMSLKDSLVVMAQTVWSNGVGASVGLEAGYAQIGSAMASRLGRAFRVRRTDLRLLVGCGAAGAIAAAFNAPLTGAFYAFELVIGTYSLATLAPVVMAAICAVTAMRILVGGGEGFDIRVPSAIEAIDYVPILALGMVCALGGIAIMRGVTLVEELFRRSRVPSWMRPGLGGLAVGALALITPAVLSSGHSALRIALDAPYGLPHIALLIFLKSTASAISIGSGFRGGLFFASLFLGALLGKLFAGALGLFTVVQALPAVVCALVGMSALAVAVVGGPLTMAFLALESTGSLPMTVAVLAASVVSAVTVRRTFGYSFATWRFHLRGEAIRSAVDVGWMRNLTVGKMMRREFRRVPLDMSLETFRRQFPLGSVGRVVAVDASGRYAGILATSEAHSAPEGAAAVADIVHHASTALLPQMTIKEAVSMFEDAESDELAVVDSTETMRVIGVVTEQFALRRYSEELERRRRELSGE